MESFREARKREGPMENKLVLVLNVRNEVKGRDLVGLLYVFISSWCLNPPHFPYSFWAPTYLPHFWKSLCKVRSHMLVLSVDNYSIVVWQMLALHLEDLPDIWHVSWNLFLCPSTDSAWPGFYFTEYYRVLIQNLFFVV